MTVSTDNGDGQSIEARAPLDGLTLRVARLPAAMEGTTNVWLASGVNDVVIRLPGRIAGVE